VDNSHRETCPSRLLVGCRSSNEKVVTVEVNDSCSDSVLASGDVTFDSIKEHKYELDTAVQRHLYFRCGLRCILILMFSFILIRLCCYMLDIIFKPACIFVIASSG